MIETKVIIDFTLAVLNMSEKIHSVAKEKGFWDEVRHPSQSIALIHSELSEALEAYRDGNPPSEKIPDFSQVEEEMADVVIRVMDMCASAKLNLGAAIEAKHAFNAGRPHTHGRKF